MLSAPIPSNEKGRIESLHKLGILDTPAEERFDRITQTAKEIFQVPIALVSIIDVNRQWFKSCIGLDVSETPRGVSFCGHAILQHEPFIIPDSTKDPRFADNPLVTGAPHVIFYAGMPIAAIDGNNVGTLCIIDTKPREFSPQQVQMLRNLGAWAQLEINSRNLATVTAEHQRVSKEIEAFFSSSYDLMWIGDLDGSFDQVNATFERVLGYTASELTSEKFIQSAHPEDKKTVEEMFVNLRAGTSVNNLVARFLSRASVYVWLQVSAVAQGQKIYATAKNISLDKEAAVQSGIQKERLEHFTKRFTFASKSAKLGIWEWDVIGNQLIWDDRMYELYGIKREQFGGAYDAWQAGLHPDDKKAGDIAIQEALAGEKEFDTSFRVVWPDTSIHYLKAYGTVERDKDGVPQRMVGVNFDITQDRQSELRLKQFEAVIRDTDDAIISKTLDGIVTSWNVGAQNLYGYTAEEIVGKSIRTIIPQEHDDLDALLARVRKGERIPSYPTMRKKKDGTLVDVSLTISPIMSDTQEIIGASVVARDITKEMVIDKEKTEFVSLASHQLKTPIGAIQWNMEMILAGDYGQISDKQKEVLEETYTMSTRMNDLVNALLNISRIEMGVFIIEPTPTDFAALCDEVLREMEPRRAEKGHTITKLFTEHLPLVPADPKLLRIVFQNFISNAIKYTPDSGKISVSLNTDESNIAFSVSNNGEPIPEKDQAKIFSKMFRASNAQEQAPDGNGLGLYVVKQIVENGGGKIWFTSKKGEDTVFTCSFPLSGMIGKTGSKQLE